MLHGRRIALGFSYRELILVVAIMGVLVGVALPIINRQREKARVAECENHLKHWGVAIHSYAQANQNKLPSMLRYSANANEARWETFWFLLLPYAGEKQIVDNVVGMDAWQNGNDRAVVDALLCPSDPTHHQGIEGRTGWAATSYAPNYFMFGTGGGYQPDTGRYYTLSKYHIDNIPDGASNTLAVTERYAGQPEWHWANLPLYPCDRFYLGWNQYGSHLFSYGIQLPNLNVDPTDRGSNNPLCPTSAHSVCTTLLMDGSVHRASSGVTLDRWTDVILPDNIPGPGRDW